MNSSNSSPSNDCACKRVVDDASRVLRESPYGRIRKLTCEYADGVLTLRGRLSSYYQKQLAQTMIRNVDGVTRVVNNAEVE